MSSATSGSGQAKDAPVSADSFKGTLGTFASGVTIVTSADVQGTPNGVTVSAFASLSLDPPLISVYLTQVSRTLAAIRQRRAFVVHILSEEHAKLGARFASGQDDKFQGVPYAWSAQGMPLLDDCSTHLECSLEQEHTGGDHVIVVGLVTAARYSADAKPLLYFRRAFRAMGGDVAST